MKMNLIDMVYIGLVHHFNSMYAVHVTNKCRIECSHCNFSCTNDPSPKIPLEYVDKACEILSKTQKLWIKPAVAFFGGEPMEEPEHCKAIADIIRKYKLRSIMVTSGFWTMDKELIEYMNNEIRPNYICISVNDNINYEKVPVKYVADYLNNYSPSKNIICSWATDKKKNTKVINDLYSNLKTSYLKIGGNSWAYGRGRESKLTRPANKICNVAGTQLLVDGSLIFSCACGIESCVPKSCNHISDLNVDKFLLMRKEHIKMKLKKCKFHYDLENN